jgi:cis-3-alkyl-4-acyloxetan-2-one decarboxylase
MHRRRPDARTRCEPRRSIQTAASRIERAPTVTKWPTALAVAPAAKRARGSHVLDALPLGRTVTFADFPYASREVSVSGRRMRYVDEGRGETLLMLHGNPTWSYLYRHLIAGLRDRYRCVAPDHLGFGRSDKPAGADYSMRAHVMRLEAFVQALGLRDVTLVVQDWGGIIGLGWAARHKALVKRLVVMNTAAFIPERPPKPLPWGFLLLWSLRLPVWGELFVLGLNGFARWLVPLGIHHRERLTSDVMRGYLDPYPTWSSRRAHLASVRQVPLSPRSPVWQLLRETGADLRGWKVPTQIIWGMRDPVFVPSFIEEFERLLPNHAPTVRLDDAGHFLQDDTPEPIVGAIRRFLEPAEHGLALSG